MTTTRYLPIPYTSVYPVGVVIWVGCDTIGADNDAVQIICTECMPKNVLWNTDFAFLKVNIWVYGTFFLMSKIIYNMFKIEYYTIGIFYRYGEKIVHT